MRSSLDIILRRLEGKARGRAVVTGGAGTAARVVELLGGIYSWVEKRDLVPAGPSPLLGVETARGEAGAGWLPSSIG